MPQQSSPSKPASRPHDEAMAEVVRDDPGFAVNLLNDILADGDQAELLIALRQMSKALPPDRSIADQANIGQLYGTLSAKPELISLATLLKAMGLRLTIERAPVEIS